MNQRRHSPTLSDRLLRIPLFWKLMAAQAVVLTLVLFLSARLSHGAASGAEMAIASVFIFTLGGVLSGWILYVALRPMKDLTETARRVTLGDWRARAPYLPYADEQTRRLGRVLNEMLDAMALSQRTQRDLSRRVLESEERERERRAHELYAGTAQTLAGVLVRLRILERQFGGDESAPSGLQEITDELRHALQEIRQVARRLRPPELDEIGVRAALEAHARTVTDGLDISMTFTGSIPEDRLSSDARLGLFRIVQEAICNAVEHAEPSRIDVSFVPTVTQLRVEVVDNGLGFRVPPGGRLADFANLGLVGMRERAEYAQGRLSISSQPGDGTRVGLVLPLRRPALAAPGHASSSTQPPVGASVDLP